MMRRISIFLAILLLPAFVFASAYRQFGSNTNPAPILAVLTNQLVSITVDDVAVADVALVLSHIADGDLSFKCSSRASLQRVTVYLTDVTPMAVLEGVCGQANLVWRIDKDGIYLYTTREENTSQLSMQAEGAWYKWGNSPIAIRLALSTNDNFRSYRYYQGREPVAGDKLPAGVIASNTVVFDFIYGVKVRPIYAEKLARNKEKYLLLWADFDEDGDYSTDESVTLEGRGSDSDGTGCSYDRSEPFDRIVSDAGHRHSARFSVRNAWVRVGKDASDIRLCIESSVAFAGVVEHAGVEINAVLQDSDADGLVAELHGGLKAADFDSKLIFAVEAETNRSIWCPVAQMMAIGTNYCSVGISMEGGISNPVALLSLVPTNAPLSKVRIKGKNVTSALLTGSQAALRLTPHDGNLLVPCGSWRVQELTVVDGNAEFVFSTEEYGKKAVRLVVSQDQDNVLNAGGPLKHGVKIEGAVFGGQITIGLNSSIGVGGESYRFSGGRNWEAPAWLIVDSKGHRIASGKFEFG